MILCEWCGIKEATKEDLDPYCQELHPEDDHSKEYHWWCDECYAERLDEI